MSPLPPCLEKESQTCDNARLQYRCQQVRKLLSPFCYVNQCSWLGLGKLWPILGEHGTGVREPTPPYRLYSVCCNLTSTGMSGWCAYAPPRMPPGGSQGTRGSGRPEARSPLHARRGDDGLRGEVDDSGQEPLQNAKWEADDVKRERQHEPGCELPRDPQHSNE